MFQERHMKREEQIKVMEAAKERAQARSSAWVADARVRASIRANHDYAHGQKEPPKRKIG